MPPNREKRSRTPPSDPNRFNEAIDAFRKRVPISDEEYSRLESAERERGFTVSGVAQADLVQQVRDEIESAIREGTPFEDFKASVGERLAEAWGRPDAYRVETVFRTNVMSAYNEGRHTVMTAPEVRQARPFWRFDAIEDSRTSDICDELDGTVRPADDPFWSRHHPPLHHACRSIVTPLSDAEAEEEGVSPPKDPENEPADGFGREPSSRGEVWAPDLSRYDEDVAAVLRDRLDR